MYICYSIYVSGAHRECLEESIELHHIGGDALERDSAARRPVEENGSSRIARRLSVGQHVQKGRLATAGGALRGEGGGRYIHSI